MRTLDGSAGGVPGIAIGQRWCGPGWPDAQSRAGGQTLRKRGFRGRVAKEGSVSMGHLMPTASDHGTAQARSGGAGFRPAHCGAVSWPGP